jgi:hypothetical protein
LKHPKSLAEQIKAYTDMIEVHLRKPASSNRCDSNIFEDKWTPPPEDKVWMNVDAALFKSSKRMGVGIVIRNHNGECVAACSELIPDVMMPELAEALAVRRAMTLARGEAYDKIMWATDFLFVVHHINSSTLDRSFLGVVIQDIKKEAEMFSSYSFFHVPRKRNVSAHVLARHSETFGLVTYRFGVPDCICEILCNDLC